MHKGSATLGREEPLEEGMAIHSSILAWRIPWTEQPGGLQSMGLQKSDMTEATKHTYTNNYPEKNTFRMHDREDWKWTTQVKTRDPIISHYSSNTALSP